MPITDQQDATGIGTPNSTRSKDHVIPVLLNSEGGSLAGNSSDIPEQICNAFESFGREARIQLLRGQQLIEAASEVAHHPLVVVGGGDGTLGSVSSILGARSSGTLGILPLGTRNHLARQLKIPMDVPGAVAVIANGERKAIDIASANDMGFVNNASIGFYPLLVRLRDAERERLGIPKSIANLIAGWSVFRRLRHHALRLQLDGETQTIRTPLLFVGNNTYSLDAGHIGERGSLEDGQLSVFAVATRTRAATLWFALRTAIGRSNPDDDFAAFGNCREATLHAHSREIHIALDGELHRMRSPIIFKIHPAALTVMVPAADVDPATDSGR